MKYGLSEKQLNELLSIFADCSEVEEIILFGSRALGTYKEASDIDLAVKGKNVTDRTISHLKDALEESDLPFFADIVNYQTIDKPKFKQHIDECGVVLFIDGESGWKKCKLGDIAVGFAMGPFGSNIKAENFVSEGIPVIRGKNLNYSRYVDGIFVYLTEKKADSLLKSNCYPGDLVFTHRGTIGQVGLIPENKYARYVVSQSGMKVTADGEQLDKDFLFYFFKSDIGQHELLQNEAQVGVPAISSPLTSLKAINLLLPPLPEQKAIAGVLSSLDDKIDLLHRQNKTLEQMAETLFRKWFVEEAGEDWEEITLYDAIDLIGGGTPKTSMPEYWGGDINWLSGGDIATNHKGMIITSEKSITESGLNNSSAKLLPKYSMVISARGTVGKYCMLSEPMAFSQSNYGIKPKYPNTYYFTYLLVAYSVDELQSAAYGSVFDAITTNTFKSHSILLPKESIIQDFDREVMPFFEKVLNNSTQIQTLENLRDTLLPKLMSGEVRIACNG